MKLETKAVIPNSVILVMDYISGEPPENMNGKLISANKTCIAVGTLAEHSGDTHLVLTNEAPKIVQSTLHIAFDGVLTISSGNVSIVNVLDEKLLTLPVLTKDVRLRVLVNNVTEPDYIVIVVE